MSQRKCFLTSNWGGFFYFLFLLRKHHHSTHYRAQVGVDTQPIKVCRILPVMHPGVLYQHVAPASLQEVHIEKKEGPWSNWAISSCSALVQIKHLFSICNDLLCRRLQLHGYDVLLINLASERKANTIQTCLWIDDFTPGYRLLLLLGHAFD